MIGLDNQLGRGSRASLDGINYIELEKKLSYVGPVVENCCCCPCASMSEDDAGCEPQIDENLAAELLALDIWPGIVNMLSIVELQKNKCGHSGT